LKAAANPAEIRSANSLISGKENAAMDNDTTIEFQNPAFRDEMTDLIRAHAQTAIRQAILAELDAFLGEHDDADPQGCRNVVRNGYQPERQVLTGVGPVSVKLPKTRDRAGQGRCFRSLVLPPYLKKTRRLEAVLPWLYLKGVSTNDFDEALTALFGESARGLSPSTISRLKSVWQKDYEAFREHDWRGHEMVYLWAEGIYINARSADRRCVLVLIGCDAHGRKHFLAIDEGFRESTESWKALLLGLRDRGLTKPPKLAVGDGAMGRWDSGPHCVRSFPKPASSAAGCTRRPMCSANCPSVFSPRPSR